MNAIHAHAVDLAALVMTHLADLPPAMKCKAATLCTQIWCELETERQRAAPDYATQNPLRDMLQKSVEIERAKVTPTLRVVE